jgi:hypothetical protein
MQTLVVDACLLITLGNADSLWLLRDLPGWSAVTCPRAVAEVSRPPAANRVRLALEDGWLTLVAIDPESDDEARALTRFDDMPAFRDRADAEVLALAAVSGYAVGSDDRRVRTEARRLPGVSAIGSVDLLVTHLRAENLRLDQAGALLAKFDVDVSVDLSRFMP